MELFTRLLHGNCLDRLKEMEEHSVDSIVTDPPYGLSFMGKKWDYDVPSVEIWSECLRVLKPGGHLLAFAGTRTQHRMAVNIEDAGFEIRDMIAWVYGSGFPKSLNIGKAVDKIQGNERVIVGEKSHSPGWHKEHTQNDDRWTGAEDKGKNITKGNSEWEGWGTALKPALEPITVARKPIKGTVADNVLKWGTGGLNIDGCRVGTTGARTNKGGWNETYVGGSETKYVESKIKNQGRFPANLIHDGSDEVVRLFPSEEDVSQSRFFYCAKASKSDRDEGCEQLDKRQAGTYAQDEWSKQNMGNTPDAQRDPIHNHHPTVKPTDLMRYLVKLVTPPEGVVLDPFMGSGSTGKACVSAGFSFIGIEMEQEYIDIAKARIEREKQKGIQTGLF